MTTELPSDMDFPAAHSMDATWFAVDRDGHVGVFESGEPGAVPKKSFTSIAHCDDAVEMALETLPVTGEPRFELSAVCHPCFRSGVLPPPRRLARGWPSEGGANLLLFR